MNEKSLRRALNRIRRRLAMILAAALVTGSAVPAYAVSENRALPEEAGMEAADAEAAVSENVTADDSEPVYEEAEATAQMSGEVADEALSDYAKTYDCNAVLMAASDNRTYPGVYAVKALSADQAVGEKQIGIPSIAKQNIADKPTTESPAIIMGAAVPYEKKTGPVSYEKLPGAELYAPYSSFRYELIDEPNHNGEGIHTKMSGYDGTYIIIRVDVSDLIKGAPEGSYLHMKQDHNKALMVYIGQDISEGAATFSDAGGTRTGAFSLSENGVSMMDKDGSYRQTPFIDVILLSSGTLVQGADTGSGSLDPKAPLADFGLSFYIDSTADYDPDLMWNQSLGTAVRKSTGKPVEKSATLTAEEMVLNKYFDEAKAKEASADISRYKIMGSDIELETQVEDTEGGKPLYWSLRNGLGYDGYNDRAQKLICEVPLLEGLNVTGSSDRHVILDVNSFDIQLANHTDAQAASLTVDGATLSVMDSSNTTGAELAVGNNARMEIKNNGRLIIEETAQLEVEYDSASLSQNETPEEKLTNGVMTVNSGGVLENRGIITVEGREGKPQDPGDVVVRDYMNARLTIDEGGTLENKGCLLVNGELYNFGTIKNEGRYPDVITSTDPDKGTFTYHRGIQLSWKDDITQGHTIAGEFFNGLDENGTVHKDASLVNSGDLVMVPGELVNSGRIENSGNIYTCAVDKVIIPIKAYADQPLITEQEMELGYFECSDFINNYDGRIENSGRIGTAEVEIVSNGRTGALKADELVDLEELNLRSFGTVSNNGRIDVHALYASSAVTNSGDGYIDRLILCSNNDKGTHGSLTDSSASKATKVYNGARILSGGTAEWTYADIDSLRVSEDTRRIEADPGTRVRWKITAKSAVSGDGILYSVMADGHADFDKWKEHFDIPAGGSTEIESPVMPDISGNAVYEFYAEEASGEDDADRSWDYASVRVKGSGIIKPTAMRDLIYNGKEQPLVTPGSAGRGKVKYRLGDTGEYLEEIPKQKNAGDYTVYYKVFDENGNDLGADGTINTGIAKREAFIAADDRICKKGAARKELTYISYGVVSGDDIGITLACDGLDTASPGTRAITVSYTPDDNYTVKTWNGTYTVLDTAAELDVGVQAVLGQYNGSENTISMNIVYNTGDEDKTATVYYSLSKELGASNYEADGTTIDPAFGGMGEQIMYYYIKTPDGGAGGSKPVVVTRAEQEPPTGIKGEAETRLIGEGGMLSGLMPFTDKHLSMEYRRADETEYTKATSQAVFVSAGDYLVRYSGNIRYRPSGDTLVSVRDTVTAVVRYESNGGSRVPDETGLTFGDTVQRPADPVKSGYIFDDWYSDISFMNPYDFSKFILEYEDITLFAKWICEIPGADDQDMDDFIKDVPEESLSINRTTGTVAVDGREISTVTKDADGKESIVSRLWIGGLEEAYYYTGAAIKPQIHVYDGVKELILKTDYTLSYKNNKNAGRVGDKKAPSIIIKFKGNYQGNPQQTVEFNIAPARVGKELVLCDTAVAALKNNKEQKPVPTMICRETGKTVSPKLFKITYDKPVTGKGSYRATVSADSPNYQGYADCGVTVIDNQKLLLSKASVKVKAQVYTGSAITPSADEISVKLGAGLKAGEDYEIEDIYNNTEPGTAVMVLRAVSGNKAGYAGTKTAVFRITKGRELNDAVEGGFRYEYDDSVPYIKSGAKPVIRVYDGDRLLKEKTDYTVSYRKNRAETKGAMTAEAVIKGRGLYKKSVTLKYAVLKQDINELTITAADQFVTKGKYKKPKLTITDKDGKKLGTKDYSIAGEAAFDEAGETGVKVTISVNGTGNYTGTASEVTFRLMDKASDISKAGKMKNIPSQVYTGRYITLNSEDLKNVLYTGKKASPAYLEPGKDYIITGYTNNLKKGTAKVTVQGIDGMAGSRTLTFKIVQRKTDYNGVLVNGKWRK